jgi:hypothetical protein
MAKTARDVMSRRAQCVGETESVGAVSPGQLMRLFDVI